MSLVVAADNNSGPGGCQRILHIVSAAAFDAVGGLNKGEFLTGGGDLFPFQRRAAGALPLETSTPVGDCALKEFGAATVPVWGRVPATEPGVAGAVVAGAVVLVAVVLVALPSSAGGCGIGVSDRLSREGESHVGMLACAPCSELVSAPVG